MQAVPDTGPHEGGMVLGGLLGGVAGLIGGAGAGSGVEQMMTGCTGGDWCGFAGAVFGAIAGESLGVALGAHLAGGRRGNYALEAAASLGIAVAGVLIGTQVDKACGGGTGCATLVVLSVPVLQIAASAALELRGARR